MDTSIVGNVDPFAEETSGADSLAEDSGIRSVLLQAGTYIQGKYCVRGVLGQGGFAIVYDAEHVGLGRPVAIKVLHIGPDTPLALIERFRREARISALVRHPNVLEVYDTGQLADGSPFLVMERVNGENLSALIQRGPLSIAMTVEIGRQLLLGLGAITEAGIVHRDVKPDNIMLHDVGDGMPLVKLVDFGISKHVSIEPHARLTCHGALIGTPQYMSPEQIRGEDVDLRTDIYAAGAVLYEALTGHAPHERQNFSELVVAILNSRVRPISELRRNCPAALERIIFTALARARTRRYSSPRDFRAALEEFACNFDLPGGAHAFRARDHEASLQLSVPRISLVGASGSFGPGSPRRRALQVALVALTLSAPGAVEPLPGQTAATAVAASPSAPDARLITAEVAVGGAGEAPLALAVDSFLRRAAAAPAPGEVNVSEAAPSESEKAVHVRTNRRRTADAQGAAPAPAESASVAAAQPVSTDQATPEADEQGEGGVDEADGLRMPAELTAAERASWDQAMQQALAALVRGQLGAAKSSYARATRIAPREPAGFRGLGLVAARLGDHVEARSALRHYLTLAPTAADATVISARISALKH